MREIDYLGKTFKTGIYKEISDEEYEQIVRDYRQKPNVEDVKVQMFNLYHGKNNIDLITRYYFRDLMDRVRVSYCKWSIEEVIDSKELVECIMGVIERNKNVYLETEGLIRKIDNALRIGLGGVCHKIAQFPYKLADMIVREYNVNNNYYDFSCGWGCRLLASMVNEVNYYGTDPNHELIERLYQMENDYKEIFNRHSETKIYCQGSEEFIPELENKIGLAFSSPPYFGLEDYGVGNQSYSENTTYKSWLQDYLVPTIRNIKRYLIDDGYFIINIKDYDVYKLEEHTIKITEKLGFKLQDILLKDAGVKKVKVGDDFKSYKQEEKIFVFVRR